jgi:polyisoprenoid-binding protein YceI
MISNVLGEFTSLNGVLELDENDITKSKIRAAIDAGTINTREPQRDAHLKSPDFFHVEDHPNLTFNSTSLSKNTDGELKVSGDLTIRGVTRNVVFDVEGPSTAQKDPWGNTRIGLSATTRISRKDFGLTWNAALEAGGLLVGDAVTITLDVQFINKDTLVNV